MPISVRSTPLLTKASPVNGIVYNEPRKLANHNSIRVDLYYDTSYCHEIDGFKVPHQKQKVIIQTPVIHRAFPKEWINKDQHGNEVVKYDIGLSLRGYDSPDSEISTFYQWVEMFEGQTKEKAIVESQSWFKKQISKELINAYFTSCLKESSDPSKYPPTLKVNVPYRYKKFEIDVFGPGGSSERLTFNEYMEMSRSCEVMAIIEWENCWFMPKGFGATPILRALQVFPEDKLTGYSFNLSAVPEEKRKLASTDVEEYHRPPQAHKSRHEDLEANNERDSLETVSQVEVNA